MKNDLISRQQAIDAICEHGTDLERRGITVLAVANHKQVTVDLLENLPSAQPEIIRCKDCVYQTESWSGIKYCEAHGDHIGKDYDYCSNARRKENGQTDFTASGD